MVVRVIAFLLSALFARVASGDTGTSPKCNIGGTAIGCANSALKRQSTAENLLMQVKSQKFKTGGFAGYSSPDARTPSSEGPSSCCSKCEQGLPSFCSPQSGSCYDTQKKDYYESCPDGGLAPSSRLQPAASSEGALRFMSYNLFGWNAFNQNKWRSKVILEKVSNFKPAVFGAQEVETGGGSGGGYVSDKVTSSTGLSAGVGLNQFFDATIVEALDHKFIIPLVRGYWMSMTRFRHKATNVEFLFFNSHWKHGYGGEQKKIIANAIHAERERYNAPPPTIFVGDTNQFCMAADQEAIRYLKGEEGDSPVIFADAIAQDKGSSYDGGCRIDFILASKGEWLRVDSFIDRNGMGARGSASDHAALMAELVPVPGNYSLKASEVRHVDATCCDRCSGSPFCSPESGTCYESKSKDYYLSCSTEISVEAA